MSDMSDHVALPPVVLLHAYPVDSRMWDPVRPGLAGHVDLITPDQRGLGRAPLGEAEPDLDLVAADVLALLDRLALDRVVLGGCSMGGYAALALLRAAPERVAGLVLIDTRATADTDAQRTARLAVARRAETEGIDGWLADGAVSGLLNEATRIERPTVMDDLRELAATQRPPGVAWAQRAMAARRDSTDLLATTDVPALVIVGEDDQITPVQDAEFLASRLPDAELVVVPRVGHLPPMEAPDAVVEALLAWLPSVRTGAATDQ
jgi:pimeloyl-ACP methyl ester carboxylesterase